MPAQQILKALPPLFESKDAKARGSVKEIVVSCWWLCAPRGTQHRRMTLARRHLGACGARPCATLARLRPG
jgi:hypothetical protein